LISLSILMPLSVHILMLLASVASLHAATVFRVVQHGGSDLIQISAPKPGRHKLEIDDGLNFRTPVLTRVFNGPRVEFHGNDAGLIPGIEYHARLDGGRNVRDFRLGLNASFNEPAVNCAMLRSTWEQLGRLKTGVAFSRVQWDTTHARWVLLPHTYLVGASLYNTELYLRPALNAARACNNLQTLDEVAQYYLVMLQQTETVGALLSRPNVTAETKQRLASTDRSARTFAAAFGDQVGEGELYNAQWLHPAAQLVRLISLLPEERRTPAMKTFALQYTPFIVSEHLERYFLHESLSAPGGGRPVGRIERWKLAMRGLKGDVPWDTAMSDIDLWLLASAAEMLGANANDAALAPLDANQVAMLRSALRTGVGFFQSKRTDYPETKNFQGERTGSASYFNGDYTAHPDYLFSGVTGEKFPTLLDKRVNATASWDISHTYRLPIFLRALYENRKATGVDFPRYRDLQLVVNQYVYRVFNGDFSHPLFHNYFDGSDGWHRVGFNGFGFGYPPSRYCNMHDEKHPCQAPGNIIAWGQLAFANPDLARLEQALVKLAFDEKPDAQAFRDRYYFYDYPYQVIPLEGKQVYGTALYFVIAENAGMIASETAKKLQVTSYKLQGTKLTAEARSRKRLQSSGAVHLWTISNENRIRRSSYVEKDLLDGSCSWLDIYPDTGPGSRRRRNKPNSNSALV